VTRTRLLDTPPAGWSALLRSDANATPAHRPEVAAALAGVLGMEPAWVAVEDGHGLAGGASFCLERRAGARWLHAMPFLLPGAPLAREGAAAVVDAAVASAIAGLQRDRHLAGGEWCFFYRPAGGVESSAIDQVPGRTTVFHTAVLRLAPGTAFESGLDRDERHLLRRARRAGLAFAEDPAALDEVYALHLAQSRAWRGHTPLPLELSRRLLESGLDGAGPAGRVVVLRAAGRLVAGMFVLDHDREVFAWWSGARREGRSAAATRLLMAATADWAAARGRSRLNLGGSGGIGSLSDFKRSLGAVDVPVAVRWLDASCAPWPARGLAAVQSLLRRGRFRGAPA
jgi:hypothetical protein